MSEQELKYNPNPNPRMSKEIWLDYQASIFNDIIELTRKKNADYTAGSSDPFANFRKAEELGVDPFVGLCLRMEDKFQRVKAFISAGKLEVAEEGIADALRDIIGYSALAMGMLQEQENNKVWEQDNNSN